MWWHIYGQVGPAIGYKSKQSISVVIATFNEVRGPNLQHLVNNIFKCRFVSELIISNHNPDLDIAKWIKYNDPRIKIITTAHKCVLPESHGQFAETLPAHENYSMRFVEAARVWPE